jgi:signal peptidase I
MSEAALMEEKSKEVPKRRYWKEISFVGTLLVLFFAIKSTCYEPFRIPSGSMIPTLMVGDFILVDKLSYGLKVPFSGGNILGYNFDPVYLTTWGEPERGDVVVFKFPKDPSIHFIKRIVGVPGDYIEIKNKMVYINDEMVPVEEISGDNFKNDLGGKYSDFNLKFYKSKLGDNTHVVQYDQDNFYRADLEKKRIPKGYYFVLGDNRDFSHDSRFWGMVPKNFIKGKASLVWFSMILPEDEKNDENFKIRYGRIGAPIL